MILELRSDAKKCKEDIGHFLDNNDININNWNTMTSKIITILKNNYTKKTNNKTKQTSEYTKDFINKQTQLNYEIFGQTKKLILNNKNILICKIFKAWKHTKSNDNNIDNFLNKNINSKNQNLVKINKKLQNIKRNEGTTSN